MPSTLHPISEADQAAMTATREFLKTMPALALVPAVRPFFDDMISQVPLAEGIEYEAKELGGVPGWWCRAAGAPTDAAILYLHGGGYIVGSAKAYRHPVGQVAAAAGVSAFVPDYGLAPEEPFPAGFNDAVAVYDALVRQGVKRVAIVGDSAGGGLALALLALVSKQREVKPVAAVAISPWADLTVSGQSMDGRAAVDPLLSRATMQDGAALYLAGADARDPRASPLFGNLDGLPPTLIHVGDDEVLLDDAVRYAQTAEQAGSSVDLHVWAGMVHVFTSSITTLEAARQASKGIGAFLARHVGVRG
jgi:acetyl esterase/lipase